MIIFIGKKALEGKQSSRFDCPIARAVKSQRPNAEVEVTPYNVWIESDPIINEIRYKEFEGWKIPFPPLTTLVVKLGIWLKYKWGITIPFWIKLKKIT